MIIANYINPVALPVADLPTGGSIGTAATTVDVASSFHVNQTTAGQVLTIPAPTVTAPAGQLLFIANVGTASFTIGGVTVQPGQGAIFQYSGTAWIPLADVDELATRKFYQLSTFVANTALVITHNLNVATPQAITVDFRDATGNPVDIRLSAFTANTVTATSPVALSAINTTVIG